MRLFRTILVAADLSEASREAFRVACSLADEVKTRLFVLSVMEPKYEADTPVYLSDQTIHYTRVARDPSDHEHRKERLRELYAPGRALDVDYRTREGDAIEQILLSCKETDCDLLVMGTHGRTGLRRLLAGSVAEAVLRRAPCPVLAFREPEAPLATPREDVILHPTDFSANSRPALESARALALARGSRLILLHVIPIEGYADVPLFPDHGPSRAALASLAEEVDGPDLKHPVETRLSEGQVAAEIIQVADEADCSLIVMGTHGATGLSRLLMGSVAESVLRKAGRPILILKPAQPEASPLTEATDAGRVTA